MHFSHLHYFPLAWPFIVGFFLLYLLVLALVELRFLQYAYERMGIDRRYVFLLLLLSLLGSYVNIPLAQLPAEQIVSHRVIDFFGVLYEVPVAEQLQSTTIAINVGGALIPATLSIYLWLKNRLFVRGIIATAVVAWVVHLEAYPVRGLGISVPIFIPPLVAAGVAMILSSTRAAPLAFIAGSLGTLIGADLMNLGHIQGLGAPVASIGGAGTFDGVFLSGIIAVLLPPAPWRPRPRAEPSPED